MKKNIWNVTFGKVISEKKLLAVATMMVGFAGASSMLASCSSSDDGVEQGIGTGEGDKKDEHVAVESILVQAMKDHQANGMELGTYGSFGNIHYSAMSGTGQDSWRISVGVVGDPGDGKWQGTYKVSTYTSATVRGFEKGNPWEKEKARLYADDTEDHIIKGAWIKFEYQGTKNSYDQKLYKVSLHIPELKEENGDYARNIDVTFTGYVDGGMLEY